MSEHNEQCAFVEYVLWTYRNRDDFLRPLFFSVPNGMFAGGKTERGDFRYRTLNKMKAEGFLPGVADILYLQPRGDHPFLAIEMKDPKRRNEKDGGLSEDQKIWQAAAATAGAYAFTCFDCEGAIHVFDLYMGMPIVVKDLQNG